MKKTTFTLLLVAQSYAMAANITVSDALNTSTDGANYHTLSQAGEGIANRVLIKTDGGTILNTAAATTVVTKYWIGYYVGGVVPTTASGFISSITDQGKFVPLGLGVAGLGSLSAGVVQQIGLSNGRLANTMTGVTYLDGTPNAISTGGINRGTRLHLILLNQADTTERPTTELGVFSATSWTVPATGTANMTVSLKDVDTAAEVYFGDLGSLVLAPIVVVPEASSSALALLAGLGLMSRRRR